MSFDPYLYPGTKVLKNKLNIRDARSLNKAEYDFSFQRSAELKSHPINGKFDYDHLKRIHGHLFQDVYEWAGIPRTIAIYKAEALLEGRSIPYPIPDDPFPPDNMNSRADYAFQELKKDRHLKGLERKLFIEKLSKHMSEIWEVHPFRDGNTRTVTVFMMQIAKDAGHPFKGKLGHYPSEVRDAFVLASEGKKEPLKALIAEGLGFTKEPARDTLHLKSTDPGAHLRLAGLETTAKDYAGHITSDKASQDEIANRSVNRAYERYEKGQSIPDVTGRKPLQPTKKNGYDNER
jgi:cell filamentation protein